MSNHDSSASGGSAVTGAGGEEGTDGVTGVRSGVGEPACATCGGALLSSLMRDEGWSSSTGGGSGAAVATGSSVVVEDVTDGCSACAATSTGVWV